ncbi:MAG: hypothetical protein HYZ92_03635 [Candidatus Omnitrophica bacterium]|nr:hypothetical protein [Candidatus Omnitrophota bacterium]
MAEPTNSPTQKRAGRRTIVGAIDDLAKIVEQIRKKKPDKYQIATGCAAVVSIIAGLFGIWFGVSNVQTQALLFQRQRLAERRDRPFVAIHDVHWWRDPGTDWFGSTLTTKNYGGRLAANFRDLNFRAVVFRIDDDLVKKKVRSRTPEPHDRYLGEYTLDEKNRLIIAVLEMLGEYFKRNPTATRDQMDRFLSSLSPTSPELSSLGIFSYDGQLLFKSWEINHDMTEYLSRQQTVIAQNEERKHVLSQQMGQAGLQGILEGDKLLVVYWAFQYQDALDSSSHSSFYLGYSHKGLTNSLVMPNGRVVTPLQEFRTWSEEG